MSLLLFVEPHPSSDLELYTLQLSLYFWWKYRSCILFIFGFKVIPSDVQSLYQALQSRIPLGGARGSIWDVGSAAWKVSSTCWVISLAPKGTLIFIFWKGSWLQLVRQNYRFVISIARYVCIHKSYIQSTYDVLDIVGGNWETSINKAISQSGSLPPKVMS